MKRPLLCYFCFVLLLFAAPAELLDLHLVLCLGNTHCRTQRTICSTRNQSHVSCEQGKYLFCIISPEPKNHFYYNVSNGCCNALSQCHLYSSGSFCKQGEEGGALGDYQCMKIIDPLGLRSQFKTFLKNIPYS